MEEHNANLAEVLDRLNKAGLRLKLKKCKFAQRELEYLGHVVTVNGVNTAPKKTKVVEQFPIPANLKLLRLFLGLASYYRRFIPNFTRIAGLLHALTRKDTKFV